MWSTLMKVISNQKSFHIISSSSIKWNIKDSKNCSGWNKWVWMKKMSMNKWNHKSVDEGCVCGWRIWVWMNEMSVDEADGCEWRRWYGWRWRVLMEETRGRMWVKEMSVDKGNKGRVELWV